MQSFGTEEYGNKGGFKVVCCQCGREARLIPTHHFKDGEYKHPDKITLELRCICGNKFGATIHS